MTHDSCAWMKYRGFTDKPKTSWPSWRHVTYIKHVNNTHIFERNKWKSIHIIHSLESLPMKCTSLGNEKGKLWDPWLPKEIKTKSFTGELIYTWKLFQSNKSMLSQNTLWYILHRIREGIGRPFHYGLQLEKINKRQKETTFLSAENLPLKTGFFLKKKKVVSRN